MRSSTGVCETAFHEQLKREPRRWIKETEFVGVDGGRGGELLMLVNCLNCKAGYSSTLGIPLSAQKIAEHYIAILYPGKVIDEIAWKNLGHVVSALVYDQIQTHGLTLKKIASRGLNVDSRWCVFKI